VPICGAPSAWAIKVFDSEHQFCEIEEELKVLVFFAPAEME
jgi:hypothetical protein